MRPDEPGERTWPPSLVALYEERRVALLRCAFLICGSRATAEDVVQEAVAAVATRWSTVENGPAYLFTTVANRARDHVRREGRAAAREWLGAEEAPPPDLDEHLDLWRALARLPADQRTTIVLRYHEGWSDAEIAAALGKRPATIRSWRHRAFAALRRDLTHDG